MTRAVLTWLAFVSALGASSIASAALKDEQAKQSADHAMNELFVAAKFDEAKAALEQTLAECAGCAKQTLAKVHLDLGIVWFTAFQNTKKGNAEIAKAKALDPTVTPDPMFTTPEVQAALDANESHGAKPPAEEVVLEDEPEEDAAPKKKHRATAPQEPAEPECASKGDCDRGQTCTAGRCVAPPPPPRRPSAWLTLGLIQDLAVASGSDACTEKSQVSGNFVCLRASGSQYHGTPLPGAGGTASGLSFATTRVTLASYFPLWDQVSAGLRVAYAFAGQGPRADGGRSFIPLQVEVQGAYWLSDGAFSTKALGIFLELSGGIAEIDGKASVSVKENTAASPPANQLDNPPTQSLEAYRKSGSSFAGVGIGTFLPFCGAAGLLADLRASALFPSPGFAISLGVSAAMGL